MVRLLFAADTEKKEALLIFFFFYWNLLRWFHVTELRYINAMRFRTSKMI